MLSIVDPGLRGHRVLAPAYVRKNLRPRGPASHSFENCLQEEYELQGAAGKERPRITH